MAVSGGTHTGLNLRHTDGRVDDLTKEGTCERADGMLGGTVNGTTSIWLTPYNKEACERMHGWGREERTDLQWIRC